MTLILNNDQIADLVSMQECVDVLEDAFVELAEGRGAYRRRSDICTPSTHPSGGMYALNRWMAWCQSWVLGRSGSIPTS